jgi:hypothetical protein
VIIKKSKKREKMRKAERERNETAKPYNPFLQIA